MKKNLLLITIIITTVFIINSCQKKSKEKTSNKTETSTEINSNKNNEQKVNFITLRNHFSNKYANASYFINYPDKYDTSIVAKNIRIWINKQMGNKYKGNINNADSLMNWYENKFIKTSTKKLSKDKDLDGIKYEQKDSIYITYKTNKVISVVSGTYFYSGGAHGGYGEIGNTFNILNGKSYGWNMIKDKKALRKLIKNGLKKYFKVKTDKDLIENLFGDIDKFTVNTIPLPKNPPYFTNEGLKLSYGQYEICAYSFGMPYVIIPFDKLKNILTEEVNEMIK